MTWHVAKREFRQILRDRPSLVLILVMPVLLTILFAKTTGRGNLRDIPILILNEDGSTESNLIISALHTHDEMRVLEGVRTVQQAHAMLAQGKIKAVVGIPRDFFRQVQAGEEARVDLLLDGTDPVSARIIEGVTRQVIAQYNKERAIGGLSERGVLPARGLRLIQPVSTLSEIRYNSEHRHLGYVMPAVIGLTLQLLTVTLMAVSIPRERERGTFEQLMASPITRTALIVGKLLPYFCIALFNIGTILLIVDRVFGIPIARRLPLLLGLCALFVLSSLATGLLISSVSRSPFQAVQIAVFYVLPVFILSGAYAPIEVIPEYVRPISHLFPLMYFLRAVRAATLRDADFLVVWKDLLILGGFGIVYLYWAVLRLQKQVA
jgi:ABC-2 type transport system permease protein